MARSLVRLARRGSAISFSCESFISLGWPLDFYFPKGGELRWISANFDAACRELSNEMLISP